MFKYLKLIFFTLKIVIFFFKKKKELFFSFIFGKKLLFNSYHTTHNHCVK